MGGLGTRLFSSSAERRRTVRALRWLVIVEDPDVGGLNRLLAASLRPSFKEADYQPIELDLMLELGPMSTAREHVEAGVWHPA